MRLSRSLGLFLDGTTPLAKMALQRVRRLRAYGKLNRLPWNWQSQKEPSSLDLTVGSSFMGGLAAALRAWARRRLNESGEQPPLERCYLSSSSVPGEADTKLFALVHELGKRSVSRLLGDGDAGASPDPRGPTVAVVGEDSDLIVMAVAALSLCPALQLTLLPYWVPGDSSAEESAGSKSALLVPVLAESLHRSLDSGPKPKLAPRTRPSPCVRGPFGGLEMDFVVVCLLLGNDCLPRLRGCPVGAAGAEALWRRYCQATRGSRLVQCASKGLGSVWPGRSDSRSGMVDPVQLLDALADLLCPSLHRAPLVSGVATELDWKTLSAPDSAFVPTSADRGEVLLWAPGGVTPFDVAAYVEGLPWSLAICTTGCCLDYSVRYAYPYAPSGADIAQWVRSGGGVTRDAASTQGRGVSRGKGPGSSQGEGLTEAGSAAAYSTHRTAVGCPTVQALSPGSGGGARSEFVVGEAVTEASKGGQWGPGRPRATWPLPAAAACVAILPAGALTRIFPALHDVAEGWEAPVPPAGMISRRRTGRGRWSGCGRRWPLCLGSASPRMSETRCALASLRSCAPATAFTRLQRQSRRVLGVRGWTRCMLARCARGSRRAHSAGQVRTSKAVRCAGGRCTARLMRPQRVRAVRRTG